MRQTRPLAVLFVRKKAKKGSVNHLSFFFSGFIDLRVPALAATMQLGSKTAKPFQ